jgi:DUF4097 and DUF4098 domain-containing protein YvlB
MKNMRIKLLTALAFLGLATALATPTRGDDWNKKYSLTGKPDVSIRTNDGNVEITSGAQGEIEAHVITTGWRIPSEVRVEERQDGNHLEIEVRVPTHWSWFSSSHNRNLRIVLHVPREADLDVRTGDGNVSTENITGRTVIDTGDGNIDADGLRGDLRLHTSDGHVQGRNLDGSLDVDTGDGHVTIRGRFDSLRLKTGDGHVNAEIENGSKIGSQWSVSTGDGNVSLRVPADFHADLDAHTGDGHISLDFPVTVSGSLSNSTVHGKLNGGGGTLLVRTGDGSITIEKL